MIDTENGVIRVVSLSTPYPKRIHLMGADGLLLCDNQHLRVCIAREHPGYLEDIQVCTPCINSYNRTFKLGIFA